MPATSAGMTKAVTLSYARAARSRIFPVPAALRYSRFLRIHQHERDAARLFAVIEPGVVGRLLDNDVAGFEVHRAGVELHIDLAGNDDRVIHRAGAMHQRIARRRAAFRYVRADRFHRSIPRQLVDAGTDRWKIDDQ